MKLYAIQYITDDEIRNLSNQLFNSKKSACQSAIDIFVEKYGIDDDPSYINQIYDALYLYDIYVDKDGNTDITYQITEFNY